MLSAEERVSNGIALFQEKLGDDWLRRMDLDNLFITSTHSCAACQATGIPYYGDALKALGVTSGQKFGFTTLGVRTVDVQNEWERQITALRDDQYRTKDITTGKAQELAVA